MSHRFRYFIRETWLALTRNPLMSVAGALTMFVCLTVLGGGILIMIFNNHGTERFKGGVKFEIYMNVDASKNQIEEVKKALEDSADVKSFTFLSKADAYEEFKKFFRDEPDLVNSIDASALPASFRVAPKQAEETTQLSGQFQTLSGVDDVAEPGEALQAKLAQTRAQRNIYFVASAALLIVSIVVVVNTVLLATYARRREIEVMKLVGASNWFVRIPFIAEGGFQGFVGGLAACFFVVFVFFNLDFNFAFIRANNLGFDLMRRTLFRDETGLRGFFAETSEVLFLGVSLVLLGTVIGVAASLFGTRRYLDEA